MDNVLVFLYKRELLDENNDTISKDSELLSKLYKDKDENKIEDYVLSPIEIVEGKIKTDENGIDIFYSKDGKYELKMIDEIAGINDEFVYAFPIDVESYNDEDKKETIEAIKNEELYNTYLLQSYSEKLNEMLNTFTYNVYTNKVLVLINPYDYDESMATLIYDITDYADKLPENKMAILTYESIQKLEEQNEEEKEEAISYESKPHKAIKYSNDYIYSDELYDEIRKYVISQDEQIRTISTIFAKNQRLDNPYMKSNFILCGPTGCGKTEIFRRLSSIANVPMIIEDATEFTAAGYVGRSVTSILSNLYNAADGDLKKAENGIILIDEIDKKASSSNNLEVTKGAVIQSLLKMIEGHTYPIVVGKKQIYFDTSRVTFAFSGAFSGIEKYVKYNDKNEEPKIGFGVKRIDKKDIDKNELYNTQTLKNYGLLPEFIGRNRIIAMNKLSEKDLEKILRESNLSYLKLYREFLKTLNIEFKYSSKVISAIANKAYEEDVGARSLQTIAERTLEVADYYITSSNASNYKELIITPKTIKDNKKFILR